MSSDKHPVEETPTERLLREAFAARAEQVTVHSLRPAAPPKKKLRKLKPVYAVTIPLFALAAASAGFFTIHGTPTASQQHNDPAASATATASPTGNLELPAGPSPSPSMTITPGGVPAIAQDYQSNALKVTVDGVPKGTTLTAGAGSMLFKATFTNTTEVAFPKVVPNLYQMGIGTECTTANQFQFEAGSGWKDSVTTSDESKRYDQVQRGDGAFALGPGESHTVRFQLKLDPRHPATDSLVLTVAAFGIANATPSPEQSSRYANTLGSSEINLKVLPGTGPESVCGPASSAPTTNATTQPSQPAKPGPSASAGPSTTPSTTASPSASAVAGQ